MTICSCSCFCFSCCHGDLANILSVDCGSRACGLWNPLSPSSFVLRPCPCPLTEISCLDRRRSCNRLSSRVVCVSSPCRPLSNPSSYCSVSTPAPGVDLCSRHHPCLHLWSNAVSLCLSSDDLCLSRSRDPGLSRSTASSGLGLSTPCSRLFLWNNGPCPSFLSSHTSADLSVCPSLWTCFSVLRSHRRLGSPRGRFLAVCPCPSTCPWNCRLSKTRVYTSRVV